MLTIPFLSNYIEKVVTRQLLADNVDTLNYYVTSLLLAFFSFAISCKQYFGTPIQCWVPNEFKGGWEKYAEDYCFISNSYHVPFEEEHIQNHHRGDHLSYYRWVPIMLALQAVFFFLPNYLWNLMSNNCAFNPRHYVEEASKVKSMTGAAREKEMESLADQFMEGVAVFGGDHYANQPLLARAGWNCTNLYLLTKALYVVNVIGQMVLLNSFLGGTYWSWGADTLGDIVTGREWQEAEVFPRVILCDFTVRVLAQMHTYTVQCVIMMNMINEKLYLFIYIWFLFLIALTLANFFYYLITLSIPSLRSRLVFYSIDRKRLTRRQTSEFTLECLHPDGVLLLIFIREHVGGRVATELTHKLIQKHYSSKGSISSRSSDGDHCESLEKKPFLSMPLTHFDRYDPPPKNHQMAAPKYPHMSPNNHNQTMESAPPVDEFERYTTMRMDDRSILPRPSPRTTNHLVSGLDQTDLPTARNSTPTDV